MQVDGSIALYRLHDIGYTIDLERAAALLAPSAIDRVRPARTEAQALHIKNPPVNAQLLTDSADVAGVPCRMQISGRLFDFGICSLRLQIVAPAGLSWEDYRLWGAQVSADPRLVQLLDRELTSLLQRINAAVERPALSLVTEEYTIFRISAVRDAAGAILPVDCFTDEVVMPLLLRERRPVSDDARRKLLPHRFSYYADDLTILTWDNALVVEPAADEYDVEYVIEFANAQLLELRVYDELLDAALPAMYDSIAEERGRRPRLLRRRYRPVLARLHTLVADVTETVERAENAFKVTDDVYLADIYESALRIFRSSAWRSGIERKLAIVRDTYAMLDGEAQAARGELLEVAIVVLILAEFIRSFL